MQALPRTHQDVLDLLGGPSAVARLFGLNVVNTVGHWSARGIPKGYRQAISEHLRQQIGITLAASDWDKLEVRRAGSKRGRPPRYMTARARGTDEAQEAA